MPADIFIHGNDGSRVASMNVKRLYLRYYPPGIALELQSSTGEIRIRHMDLFELNVSTHVDKLVRSIALDNQLSVQEMSNEAAASTSIPTLRPTPCHSQSQLQSQPQPTSVVATDIETELAMAAVSNRDLTVRPTVVQKPNQPVTTIHTDTFSAIKNAIKTLQRKLSEPRSKKFYLFKCLQEHILPLTNVCFDRSERYLTCSYDRTCRIFHTNTAEELHILRGHDNVVFAAGFNFPKCDKVVTASFDATAKVWNCANGGALEPLALSTLCGHNAEIIAAEFHPLHAASIATASLDGTARVFDVETSLEIRGFSDHSAEVIASRFSRTNESLLLTGSFDRTAAVWDVRQTSCAIQLRGHTAELSNCVWNYACDMIATSSLDGTARVWDIRNMADSAFIINDHQDEVLDLTFDYAGKLLATCSSDCTARVWNMRGEFKLLAEMTGHADEVSKVCFSPPGGLLLTASADGTARLWITETGECFQTLAGHTSEVFSCAFNYAGDAIITASKDNTCRLWR